jgi:hypothetical protein
MASDAIDEGKNKMGVVIGVKLVVGRGMLNVWWGNLRR